MSMIQSAADFLASNTPVRVGGNTVGLLALLLTWLNALTPVVAFMASLASFIWFVLQIYSWFVNRRWRPRAAPPTEEGRCR